MQTLEWHRTYWGQPKIKHKRIKVPPLNKMHDEIIGRWQDKMAHHGLAIVLACMWCNSLVSWQWAGNDSTFDKPLGYYCPSCGRTWRKQSKAESLKEQKR